jgi:cell wall-associated NlpC family hydrolase
MRKVLGGLAIAAVPALAALLALAPVAAARAALPFPVGGGSPAAKHGPRLMQADALVLSQRALPAGKAAAVRGLPGVVAAQPVDAARIKMNGKYTAVLGVDPAGFRPFAARPTAARSSLWRGIAAGGVAVSYTMGKLDKLPAGGTVRAAGRRPMSLHVSGLGTVGISGVDAVISHSVARTLGFPAGNAMVVSAPHANPARLRGRLRKLMPRGTVIEMLAGPVAGGVAGSRGAAGNGSAARGAALTSTQARAMIRAATSRLGMPYVWGAAGPRSFDCSGLVLWSFARAGVRMPRVAADQARAGLAVPVSRLRAGDLLFYRTDPTAPGYISHVAIYLGKGWAIQAPQPGENVEVVRADFGSDFAGAVAVSPVLASQAAASPVG